MKKYYRLILIFICLATVFFGVNFYLQYIGQMTDINMHEFQSSIIERQKFLWNVKTIQIDKVGDFENIHFLDGNVGYANTYEKYVANFYRSTDSGKSWKNVGSIADFSVYDIFFVSETEGFLVALKLSPSSSPIENGSYIMKTEDGGQNWKTVYSSVGTIFNKIAFNAEGVGITVGFKDTPNSYFSRRNVVLMTKDKGQTWTDISENLNRIAVNPKKQVDQGLTNITFLKNGSIAVLSLRGKIYNSKNQGESWSLISEIIDEPAQSGIGKFGELEDGRFWLAGGASSIEGNWGVVAVMNNYSGWDRYRLNNYFFSDVKFISKNEAFACGSIIAENNFGGNNNLNKGIILYSSDSGKNWSIVHESRSSSEFTSIAKLSERKLFIVGKNGVGVSLERR